MDITSIIIVLFGSTFGLILRLFIQNNLKINVGFNIQNTSIVNLIASFFLGILVSLNFINNNILLLYACFFPKNKEAKITRNRISRFVFAFKGNKKVMFIDC